MTNQNKSDFIDDVSEIDVSIYTEKLPFRTFKELPEPIEIYEDMVYSPISNSEELCLVKVYPPEPSPLENLKPAFAYTTNH